MAKKKNICYTCKKYICAGNLCVEPQKKEIVIINRKEIEKNYQPNKDTQCDYYEDINNAFT